MIVTGKHCYVEQAKQGIREHVVVSDIDSDFQQTIDGDDAAHAGLIETEVDVDVTCETPGRALTLSLSILDRIKNFTGTMGDRYADAVFIEGFRGGYVKPSHGESQGRYVREISLRIQHRPS